MLFGYMRVSSDDQKHDLQHDALIAYGVPAENIVSDVYTRDRFDRPGLIRQLDKLRRGDQLVVWKLDRLGGRVKELVTIIENLRERGIHFADITYKIDTTTPAGEMMFHITAAFAQFERSNLIERTNAGLAAARARGRAGGRKPADAAKIKAALALYDGHEHTLAEIRAQTGVSPATVYRYLAARKQSRSTQKGKPKAKSR